jgi:dihydrofolate synthase/folylpolyglutamate synthase
MQMNVFQFLLSMALVYFRDQECEYVVLECGIGGWSSQTNIADADYAVITSIGLDH